MDPLISDAYETDFNQIKKWTWIIKIGLLQIKMSNMTLLSQMFVICGLVNTLNLRKVKRLEDS